LTPGHRALAEGRLGLGLWITARILHTVGGRLRLAAPEPGFGTVLVAAFAAAPAPPRDA
jgi:C4-dicarboxylate-specific signal transduction histidine kinase